MFRNKPRNYADCFLQSWHDFSYCQTIFQLRIKKKDKVINSTMHRLENRCVLRHISNMNFQSWAVLGIRGCRHYQFLGFLFIPFYVIFLNRAQQFSVLHTFFFCDITSPLLNKFHLTIFFKFFSIFSFDYFLQRILIAIYGARLRGSVFKMEFRGLAGKCESSALRLLLSLIKDSFLLT